jgi:hypothetical protein
MAHWNDTPGGLPGRLVSGRPVPIFATAWLIDRLSIYCEERHSTKLHIIGIQQLSVGTIFTVTCRPP